MCQECLDIYYKLKSTSQELKTLYYFDFNKKMNINIEDKYGNTPLHIACNLGKIHVVKHLLKNINININHKRKDGTHCLSVLTKNKYDIIKLLLDNGFDINLTDNYGNTLLMKYIEHHETKILNLLCKYKPDLHITNNNNKTIYDMLLGNNFYKINDKSTYKIIFEPKLQFIEVEPEIKTKVNALKIPNNQIIISLSNIIQTKKFAISANSNFGIMTKEDKLKLYELNITESCLLDIKNENLDIVYRLGLLLINHELYISSFMFWKNGYSDGIYNIFEITYDELLIHIKNKFDLDLNQYHDIKLLKIE